MAAHTIPTLARMFSDLGQQLTLQRGVDSVLGDICRRSDTVIPAVRFASISRGRRGRFSSVGATSPVAEQIDEVQYSLGSGPCVDAAIEDTTFRTGDLATDPRWPEFGRRAAALGARSMLATRLFLEDSDLVAALNLFSGETDAFTDDDQALAMMLATHASLAVTGAALHDNVANLERALLSNRVIGVALGVLMNTYKVTQDEAFDLLRMASQNSHQKLIDIAHGVTETGTLDVTPVRSRRSAPDPMPT